MGGDQSSPMGNVPPWVWVMLLLGGGGGLGAVTSMGIGGDAPQCEEAEQRALQAQALAAQAEGTRESMLQTIEALIGALQKGCANSNGWIE